MRILRLNLKDNPYNIYIFSKDFIGNCQRIIKSLDLPRKALVITNPLLKKIHLSKVLTALKKAEKIPYVFLVPDSERAKDLSHFVGVIKRALSLDKFGDIFFLALGGGVVGDLVGFCSSVYKRGIPYLQIPTTFLSQIDSSIGGKTAIDFVSAKNIVGSFWQPKAVITYLGFLKTLSLDSLKDSCAELIKYGILADAELFKFLRDKREKVLKKYIPVLEKVVIRCADIKRRMVEKDEKEERGIRTLLNLGHTIGHALEASSGYKYSHGKAISLGLIVASLISYHRRLLEYKDFKIIEETISDYGLPLFIDRKIPTSSILQSLLKDKKFKKGKIRFVLPLNIGKARVFDDVDIELIKRTIEERKR